MPEIKVQTLNTVLGYRFPDSGTEGSKDTEAHVSMSHRLPGKTAENSEGSYNAFGIFVSPNPILETPAEPVAANRVIEPSTVTDMRNNVYKDGYPKNPIAFDIAQLRSNVQRKRALFNTVYHRSSNDKRDDADLARLLAVRDARQGDAYPPGDNGGIPVLAPESIDDSMFTEQSIPFSSEASNLSDPFRGLGPRSSISGSSSTSTDSPKGDIPPKVQNIVDTLREKVENWKTKEAARTALKSQPTQTPAIDSFDDSASFRYGNQLYFEKSNQFVSLDTKMHQRNASDPTHLRRPVQLDNAMFRTTTSLSGNKRTIENAVITRNLTPLNLSSSGPEQDELKVNAPDASDAMDVDSSIRPVQENAINDLKKGNDDVSAIVSDYDSTQSSQLSRAIGNFLGNSRSDPSDRAAISYLNKLALSDISSNRLKDLFNGAPNGRKIIERIRTGDIDNADTDKIAIMASRARKQALNAISKGAMRLNIEAVTRHNWGAQIKTYSRDGDSEVHAVRSKETPTYTQKTSPITLEKITDLVNHNIQYAGLEPIKKQRVLQIIETSYPGFVLGKFEMTKKDLGSMAKFLAMSQIKQSNEIQDIGDL